MSTTATLGVPWECHGNTLRGCDHLATCWNSIASHKEELQILCTAPSSTQYSAEPQLCSHWPVAHHPKVFEVTHGNAKSLTGLCMCKVPYCLRWEYYVVNAYNTRNGRNLLEELIRTVSMCMRLYFLGVTMSCMLFNLVPQCSSTYSVPILDVHVWLGCRSRIIVQEEFS